MLKTHQSAEVKPELEGKEVTVGGWISQIRDLGGIRFFLLRDMSGEIQVTAKKERNLAQWEKISTLGREDIVLVRGKVEKSKRAPGDRELVPLEINVLSKAESPLPVDPTGKVKAELDTRLDWRVLDLRRRENLAIFRIQEKLVEGMVEFLKNNGFIQVFTPCLMGAPSESGSDVFPVVYFDKEVFLRQDPQLHRELIIASGFEKIFDLGPSWRAEPSHTTRHLCEHRGCAVEMGFIKDETDTMRVEEKMVVHALKKVKEECKAELSLLNKEIQIPKTPFPELRFPKIYEILEEKGKKIEYGEDYDRESELLLWKYVKEKYNSDFFFVNRFPSKVKPFYVMKVDKDPQWARSVDLLYKGLELSSGGQREHRYDKLIQQVKEKGMDLENIKWFTKFFKYGVPPLGGFNIGIERLTMQLLDIKNIREAVLFARAPERALP